MFSMRRVMAFGTFDLLHAGHKFFLQKAASLGDELVVVVARNKSVEKIKGKLPLNDEAVRLQAVSGLPFVHRALLGGPIEKRFEILKELNPDVVALGYDQKPSEQELQNQLQKIGVKAKIVRLPPFNEEKFKTSKLRRKLNH